MMREIKAIIRRDRVADVIGALHERVDLPEGTLSDVEGVGRAPWGPDAPHYGVVQMARIEFVVATELALWVASGIEHAAFTGRTGGARLFSIPVKQAVKIRSGQEGPQVL